MDDMRLALILNAISPAIGGVLVRGEKGTAKSTAVRALTAVLPPVEVCRGLPLLLLARRARPGVPRRAARRRGRGRDAPGPARGAAGRRDGRQAHRLARRRSGPHRGRHLVPAGTARGGATAACCTSMRSTCCTTTSSTCSSTRPPWGQLRGARRRVGAARGQVPARRHDEPGRGRAASPAARSLRAHRPGERPARSVDQGRGRAEADGLRRRPRGVRGTVRRQ